MVDFMEREKLYVEIADKRRGCWFVQAFGSQQIEVEFLNKQKMTVTLDRIHKCPKSLDNAELPE